MSIRIPLDAEQNLRNAFEDVEDRLVSIESEPASAEAVPFDLGQMQADIAQLQSKMNTLDLYRDADEAQADFKENNPLRVLHEDGVWKEPLDGIAKAVPAGLGTDRADTDGEREGQPSQILNVLGSLAVTGAISCERIRARRIWSLTPFVRVDLDTDVTVPTASTTEPAWETAEGNTDGMFDVTVTDRITFNTSGWYLVGGTCIYASNATGYRVLTLDHNNNGSNPTASSQMMAVKSITDAGGTGVAASLHCSVLHHFKATDYVQLKFWQNSGGNLNVLGNGRNDSPVLWAIKLSD